MYGKDVAALVLWLFLLFCTVFFVWSISALKRRQKQPKGPKGLSLVALFWRVLVGAIIGIVVAVSFCGLSYVLSDQPWRLFYADNGDAMFLVGGLSIFVGTMVGLVWGLSKLLASSKKE